MLLCDKIETDDLIILQDADDVHQDRVPLCWSNLMADTKCSTHWTNSTLSSTFIDWGYFEFYLHEYKDNIYP